MLPYYSYRLITTLIRPFIFFYIFIRILKGNNNTNLVSGLNLAERAYSKKIKFKDRKSENKASKTRGIHLLKLFKFNLNISFFSI